MKISKRKSKLDEKETEFNKQKFELDNKIKNSLHDNSIEIAKKLLATNLDIEEISRITKLNINELNKIR